MEEGASRRALLHGSGLEDAGGKRRPWSGVVAGAAALLSLTAASAVAVYGTPCNASLMVRGGGGLGLPGGQAALSLLSVSDRAALRGALAAAKGGQPHGIQGWKPHGISGRKAKPKTKAVPKPKKKFEGGWSIEKMLRNGLDWDGKRDVREGSNIIMVPPPLVVPKPPMTITFPGRGGGSKKQEKKNQKTVLIPVKVLDTLEEMNRRNKADLFQLRHALGSLKEEDKRTVQRVGEQLGALKSQITDTIKGNVMLRKEVWLVHKLPGFPGNQGIPGVDGRPGRSSVVGPGGYSGPAGTNSFESVNVNPGRVNRDKMPRSRVLRMYSPLWRIFFFCVFAWFRGVVLC